MFSSELAERFKPQFVVRDPAWLPRPSSRGDAGADVKLYVPENVPRITNTFDRVLEAHEGLKIPPPIINGKRYNSSQEAKAALAETEFPDRGVFLNPGVALTLDVGFKVALPDIQLPPFLLAYNIVSRSGLSTKYQVSVTNRPGIIDRTYRGWVKVSLENSGTDTHVLTHGSRIAQGILDFVVDQSQWEPDDLIVDSLDETERGEGGFGSTGI